MFTVIFCPKLNVYTLTLNKKLTGFEIIFSCPFVSASSIHIDQNTPEMIDNNERRRQRRLVVVLFSQSVSIEAPRLLADILHCLKRVATTTDHNKLL